MIVVSVLYLNSNTIGEIHIVAHWHFHSYCHKLPGVLTLLVRDLGRPDIPAEYRLAELTVRELETLAGCHLGLNGEI